MRSEQITAFAATAESGALDFKEQNVSPIWRSDAYP